MDQIALLSDIHSLEDYLMIAFRDFIPQPQRKRLMGVLTDYENLQELVSRANRWIEQSQIDVLNVETVMVSTLPDEAAESPQVRMTSPGVATYTYQVVRIWYRTEANAGQAYTGQTMRLDAE